MHGQNHSERKDYGIKLLYLCNYKYTMTQQGFINFLYDTCNSKTGAIKSYIMAIHIIDELFVHDDVFGLQGKSVTCIDDLELF